MNDMTTHVRYSDHWPHLVYSCRRDLENEFLAINATNISSASEVPSEPILLRSHVTDWALYLRIAK